MAIEFEYSIDGETLRAKASGFDENLLDTLKYSLGIVRLCIQHKCNHILLDEQDIEYKLSTGDTFKLVQTVVSAVPALAWVAIVTSESNLEDAAFFETTAVNRGLHVSFFTEMAEAEAWLAEK